MSGVDVIIPCYNYARFLRASAESVLSQDGVGVRALIIDDASDDDTADIGEALARADGRVEFRRHFVNHGHIATYNEGIAWAAADYVLLLSADDALTPGALRRAAGLMEAHPEVGLTYGRQIVFETEWPAAPAPARADESAWRIVSGDDFLERSCTGVQNFISAPTAVARTALQKIVGGYLKELPHSGDLEMWLRFGAVGAVGEFDAAQAYKRSHGRNMQLDFIATPFGDWTQRRAAFDAFFRGLGASVAGAERLRALADRSLATEAFWAAADAFDRGRVSECEQHLALALELYPEVAYRREWSRLVWKRRLGASVWSALRPLVDHVRSRAVSAAPAP